MGNLISTKATHNNMSLTKAEEKDCKEQHKFAWKIEDFDKIRCSAKALELHQFTFEVGNKIGLPTNWKCGLWCNNVEDEDWIGLHFILEDEDALISNPQRFEGLQVQAQVKCRDKTVGNISLTSIQNVSENKSIKLTRQFEQTDHLRLDENGSLCLDIEISLHETSEAILELESNFRSYLLYEVQCDLDKMLRNLDSASTVSPAMITMISSDGQRFKVDRAILAARSPVFLSMFQTPMQEAKKGEVKVEDISGQGLNALLGFIYTGKLPENWQNPEILEEVTYGAQKYMLEDLQEFLEEAMKFLSSTDNCEDLEKLKILFCFNQTGLLEDSNDKMKVE